MNRWEIEKKIAIKALKDPAFKKKLLANPKEALKEFLDEKQLGALTIKVYEEKKDEWIFSIPHLDTHGRQMSDQELEKLFAAACIGSGSWACN